jgi:nucleoside-diphosphate-sugar epimerase
MPRGGLLAADSQIVVGDIADNKTAAEAVYGTRRVIHLAAKVRRGPGNAKGECEGIYERPLPPVWVFFFT